MKNKFLYYFLNLTWGFPMTFIGILVAIVMLIFGKTPEKHGGCWYFTTNKICGGVNLGLIFIVDEKATEYVMNHEFGHSIQNAIFGPFMLFVVAIPSFTRYWYREFKYNRKNIVPPTDYYDIWFEGQASSFGCKNIKYWR